MADATKGIHMLDGAEVCPCGSGKVYRDCCLRTQVRWFRDASGKAVKFNMDCAPSSTSHENDTHAPDHTDSEECDHDCENCKKNGPVMLVLAKDDGVACHVNMSRFSVYDMKHALTHIAVTQARLTRALSDPKCREDSDPELELPILVVHEDEDEVLSFGSVEDLSPLSSGTIMSAIAALEQQRTEFMLMLFHIGLARGSESIIGTEDSDDDDDE